MRRETAVAFDDNMTPEPNTGCFIWTGPIDKRSGYGKIWVGRRHQWAHRRAAELAGLTIRGKVIRHSCDHPWCVNPMHLKSGTTQDNIRDKQVRGRQQQGERAGNALLTAEAVRFIRAARARGERSMDLATKYGVSTTAIYCAVSRRSWKHVA